MSNVAVKINPINFTMFAMAIGRGTKLERFLHKNQHTVFPHIRPAGINFSLGLQVRVLLEITKFHLHKSVPTAGIIRVAGII